MIWTSKQEWRSCHFEEAPDFIQARTEDELGQMSCITMQPIHTHLREKSLVCGSFTMKSCCRNGSSASFTSYEENQMVHFMILQLAVRFLSLEYIRSIQSH